MRRAFALLALAFVSGCGGSADDPTVLPRTLAGPALTTVAATMDSPGRGALIVSYPDRPVAGDIFGTQEVLVGPGNSYRTVPIGTLIDPRGRYVVLPGAHGTLTRLNLADRTERRYRAPSEPGHTIPVAISPDGTRVLYGASSDPGNPQVEHLHLLDLRSGATRDLHTKAMTAAFSPDGTKVAIGNDGESVILDPATGGRTPGPLGRRLAGDDAWSPDGRTLAYQENGELTVTLAPVDDSTEPVTLTDAGQFVGWRDPRTILVFDYGGTVSTVSGGTRTVVMTMPQSTGVEDAAGALVAGLRFTETASPDRGPWQLRFRWPLLAAAAALAATAALVVRRVRRVRQQPSRR
ncbi:TolB family protein [Cryptosporangium phraense]|nr:PD40 domain-containing protein [Cryptosporangium phraense]